MVFALHRYLLMPRKLIGAGALPAAWLLATTERACRRCATRY